MLDVKWILNNVTEFDMHMSKRNAKVCSASEIRNLYEEIKSNNYLIQKLNKQKKILADKFFLHQKDVDFDKASFKLESDKINSQLGLHSKQRDSLSSKLSAILDNIPNVLSKDVHKGSTSQESLLMKKSLSDAKKTDSLAHIDIAMHMNCVDVDSTISMCGSRMFTLKHHLAQLKRALINFMLDTHIQEFGFQEASTPCLVKESAMYNVGQLPKFAADSFVTTHGYRLIPTAEVTLVNLFDRKLLSEHNLPIRRCGFSECFRSEAGSAGKDTRGMIRMHQFSKVELISISTQDKSDFEHQHILSAAESILKKLDLPYQIVLLCGQDTPFASKKTYDLEVWLPSQKKYREISSCSNCGDFQARRMRTKYKASSGEKVLVHTLNGSGLAIERTIAAILENYTTDDVLHIPQVLQKYMHIDKIQLKTT